MGSHRKGYHDACSSWKHRKFNFEHVDSHQGSEKSCVNICRTDSRYLNTKYCGFLYKDALPKESRQSRAI